MEELLKNVVCQFDYGALYERYYPDMERTVSIGEPVEQLKEGNSTEYFTSLIKIVQII